MHLDSDITFMPLMSFARKAAVCLCWGLFLSVPAIVFSQTNYYSANGTEYAVIGSLPGDQVFPDAALTPNGGFVVWQDNATDGSGWGVSATRLDSTFSAVPNWSDHRVNVQGTNDQENARVALLKNGGAVFAWQGGKESYQHIYARFLTPTNTWLNNTDVLVSTFTDTNSFQISPAIATLNNSNVIVVWSSFNQVNSNSLQDVYGQILSPTGQKVGTNFLVNQFTNYNQRAPAVAPLKNGGFVVTWVSELERTSFNLSGIDNTNGTSPTAIGVGTVDVYGRLYQSNGVASGNEFLVNSDLNPCAYPAISVGSDGNFMITWCAKDTVNVDNSWDIYARPYSSAGAGGAIFEVNSHVYGDQYAPRISSIGADYFILWTSLGQDGSREGVFGRFVNWNGSLVGDEFRVNTTTQSQQKEPALASDGSAQFLAVWTSFTASPDSFDLFAQRYVNVSSILQAMAAPFVYAPFTLSNNVYQPQLQVTWPVLLGISVSNYEVYVDGAGTPMAVTASNSWTMTAVNGLATNSTHSFQLDYVTTDGRRSPISPSASGTTWSGLNWGGIPYEWMAEYFGGYFNGAYHTNFWPSASSPAAPGGPSLLIVFQTGGDPFDPGTWLQTSVTKTSQGMFLNWNTQPGLTYQVQVTTNFTTWSNLGAARFAAGTNDSIFVGGGPPGTNNPAYIIGTPAGYYRVMLMH
jgi:hypothetical protein